MANSILSSLIGKVSFSARSETTGIPVWTRLKIVDVEIEASSANSDSPQAVDQQSENPVLVAANSDDIKATKILQPAMIKIMAIAPDISTLENVIKVFANVYETLTISSKGVMVVNLTVTDVLVTQTPEMLSASHLEITLEQSRAPISASSYNPTQASDTNTQTITIQQPDSVLTTVGNLFDSAVAKISGLL